MRKTLSFLIVAVMMLSLFSIGTSAAEGTAINSAADFKAMEPNGKYYLNADITISETYMQPFTGTFDGNGHKVTISAPMFAQFDGLVKNLTINGTELSGKENLAAFALFTYYGMVAINVVNNVSINITGAGEDKTAILCAGGFLADSDVTSESIFRSCINNGIITNSATEVKDAGTGEEYATFAGGIVGRADGIEAKYCVNNGQVEGLSNRAYVGGIAGRAAYNASFVFVDFTDCTNTGNIISGLDAGGMAGNLGLKGNAIHTPYSFTYCVNTGEITGAYRAGGFIGYCYAGGDQMFHITSSVSIGNVSAGRPAADLAGGTQYSYAGLLVGYSNSVNNKISGSLAVGEIGAITGENFVAPFRVVLGCSSAKAVDMLFENNYICDGGTTEWYTYATAAENVGQQIPFADAVAAGRITRCTLDEVKNGSILQKLNAAADTAVFAQVVGTDLYPMIDLTLRTQREAADQYVEEEETTPPETTKKEEPVTTKPDEGTTKPVEGTDAPTTTGGSNVTDAVTDKPSGGCGSAIAGSVALVALLGGAIVIGKRSKKE